MILEYRFKGTNREGKPVQGTFTASGKREARQHLAEIRSRYQISIEKLERKRDYLYKVILPGRSPSSGRQSAFNRAEVDEALKRLGYNNFKIGR